MSHIKLKMVPASSSTVPNHTPPAFLLHKNTMSIRWAVTQQTRIPVARLGPRDGHVTLPSHSATSCMVRSYISRSSESQKATERLNERDVRVLSTYFYLQSPKSPLLFHLFLLHFYVAPKSSSIPFGGHEVCNLLSNGFATSSLSSYCHPPPLNQLQFIWPELRP